ncbi:OsmC family protein [Pararhodonellum marinum]|uniref:OsmC family protein n=1 Tax=Pararhodonellum marinum TaxID=2755358 RepID=UPI001E525916|nr:OsmC family protein [Pararhodonellum marinum]
MKNLSKTQWTPKVVTALLLAAILFNLGIARNDYFNTDNLNPKIKMETTEKKKKKANETAKINGFALGDIVGTVEAIQANPDIAKFQFRVQNKWINGGHNRSWIKDFYGGGQEDDSRKRPFVYDNSEPPILLGNNEGANPVEYILHGLAGCMTTTLALHAAANEIYLESVESKLEGDLDVQGFLGLNDQIRNGYQNIRITFQIKGDLSEDDKEKLASFVKKSPVFDIVTNQVPVQVDLQYKNLQHALDGIKGTLLHDFG